MNVLAFGAHPDDLEFMCGGTLLKYRDQGHQLFVALTTSGNTGSNVIPTKEENAAIREAEQLACSARYGAKTRFLRFEDEGLLDTPETRRAVLSTLRWANPDVILVNPPWDPSPDHGMTGKLVTEVLLSVGGKLHPADEPPIPGQPGVFFFATGAGLDFEPDVYVDITPYIEEKTALCLTHQSQFSWIGDVLNCGDQFFRDYCRTLSRYMGIRAGCPYAEGFVAHQILGYMPDYKLLP